MDLWREALVVILRNDEWACLHACAATDAARFVEDHGAEIRFEHRVGRARRGAGWLFAVHAQLAPEHPIGLRAGNDLVESNQVVVVGVEIARVLVTVAGEEIGLVLRPVVPRFARYHARPAANAPGIVLNHRFRLHCRCAHLRVLFPVTANFLGLNSPRSARRTRSSEERFINFFLPFVIFVFLRGESSVPLLSGCAALS